MSRRSRTNQIPDTKESPLLRTDYSDPEAWTTLCAQIATPHGVDGFRAYVEFIDDPRYDGVTFEAISGLIPDGYCHSFLLVADETTLRHPEHPILVIDLHDEPGRNFRVVPSKLWSVENNLSIANSDFEDFADAVDADGVYRGVGEP